LPRSHCCQIHAPWERRTRSPPILSPRSQFDVTIAIHNHGPGDRYFPTPQSVYDAVKSLDRRIGLCIDIGHTVRIGADLLGSIRNCGDRLFDLHLDVDHPFRTRGSQRNGCRASLIDNPTTSISFGSFVPSPSLAAMAR
jgi:hypothetical protein